MKRPAFEVRLPLIPLWLSVAAAIILRVLWIAIAATRRGTDAFLVPDSWGYLELGYILLTRGEFANSFGTPEIYRTPGYPLLLTAAYLAGLPIGAALAANLILTAGIVIGVFRIAHRLFSSPRIAGACALVVAMEPTMLAWSLRVMPETLLAMCLVVFAVCALRALESPRPEWVVGAAAGLCAAAYVKPVAWPLVVVMSVAALFASAVMWRKAARGRRGIVSARHGVLFLLVCAVLVTPWHLRNYKRTHYAGFSTVMERAAYIAASGSVIARRDQRPYPAVQAELIKRARERSDHARYGREGLSVVATDPIGYAATQTKGMLRTLFEPGAMEYLRFLGLYTQGGRAVIEQRGVAAVASAYPLGFWLSVGVGLVLTPLVVLPVIAATRLSRENRPAFAVLAMVAGYLIVSGGGMPATSRFRVPAVPFLVLMSAFVVRESTEFKTEKRS